MEVDLFFNELSHFPAADNIFLARARMAAFVTAVGEAIKAGCRPILRTTPEFSQAELAPEYHLYQWRNDSAVQRDHRVFLSSVSLKAPHIRDVPGTQLQAFLGCEGYYNKRPAIGLTAAFVCEGLGVSFFSCLDWNVSEVCLLVKSFGANEDLISNTCKVRHACRVEHVAQHASWLQQKNSDVLRDGIAVWGCRSQFFSKLDFCDSTKASFLALGGNDICFRPIVRRLQEIQNVAAAWNDGPFRYDKLQGQPRQESAATLQEFPECQKFHCVDGATRLFSWHVSLPNGWRLYLLPDSKRRRVHIGYVGKHLPTAQFAK